MTPDAAAFAKLFDHSIVRPDATRAEVATEQNRPDPVVQRGTDMSLMDVSEKLEPVLGIPILGINPVTFWYALRENGFDGSLAGGGRLLREF